MTHSPHRSSVPLLLGLCAAVAGCGSSPAHDAKTAPAATQTPAAFVAQATPICRRVAAKNARAPVPSSFPADLEEYGTKARGIVAAIAADYRDLAHLSPPAGAASTYAAFADALTATVASAREVVRLARIGNGDTDALGLPAQQLMTDNARAMEAAAALGLDACTKLDFPY